MKNGMISLSMHSLGHGYRWWPMCPQGETPVTVQWQDSWDRPGPIGEYHRTTPPAIDRTGLVRTAVLAVAEALALSLIHI